MKFVDHYEVLGVAPTATRETIQTAYRQRIAKEHPDRHEDSDGSLDRAKALNEARRVLLDHGERARFDHERRRRAAESVAPIVHASTRAVSRPAAPSSSGGGLFTLLAGAVLAGGAVYLASNTNRYDDEVERYRAKNGRFRRGRFF